MHNKYGKELNQAALTEVTTLPNGLFNLFCITKLMDIGLLRGGDNMIMLLVKREKKITCKIEIPTSKGTLYAI
jgi:hypothetical protein